MVEFPDVPLDGYVTFLAACRDRLGECELDVVTERFEQTATATRAWAATAGALDEDQVITWLRRQLDGCRRVPEMLTVVRAVQVEAFRLRPDGYHIHVDLLRLLATADHAPEAVAANPATWRALAAYRDPARGASCALTAAGAGMDDVTGARLDDVAADGTTMTAGDGTTFQVHPDATVYLRAQRLARRADGADGADLLFADEDGPMRARLLIGYVRAPVADLGIALATKALTGARPDSARWASRWGVSVAKL